MKKPYKLTYSIFCGILVFIFGSIYIINFLINYFGKNHIFIPVVLIAPILGGIFGYKIEKNQHKKLKAVNYVFGTFFICFLVWNIIFYKEIREAEFKIENTSYSIEMQINPVKGSDIGYETRIILNENDKKIVSTETGVNEGQDFTIPLYKINSEQYLLNGYIIDLSTKTIARESGNQVEEPASLGYFGWLFCYVDVPCEGNQEAVHGFVFVPRSGNGK